jgi:predicted AAA+ superfamily ATPase
MDMLPYPAHYASGDEPALKGEGWIQTHWELARRAIREGAREGLLVLDEAQKIAGWSEAVKRLWDEDTRSRRRMRVLLLGSSPLLVQSGLSESLAGRFEILRVPHWSYTEMRDAFGWNLRRYLRFGGYPGSASLVDEPDRWSRYILDYLVETTISRDVLLMTRVDKPALLREVFHLACTYSGRILSYTKMLGQLQDAGNTTTLAHYLKLLGGAGLVTGLPKFAGQTVPQRGSSPKLLVLNTALMTASSPDLLEAPDPPAWGRLTETAIGAHLANGVAGTQTELFYWREGNEEVDYVLRRGRKLAAIEVKSGLPGSRLQGLEAFTQAYRPQRTVIVGADGIPIDEFLSAPAGSWVA